MEAEQQCYKEADFETTMYYPIEFVQNPDGKLENFDKFSKKWNGSREEQSFLLISRGGFLSVLGEEEKCTVDRSYEQKI